MDATVFNNIGKSVRRGFCCGVAIIGCLTLLLLIACGVIVFLLTR